MTFSAVRKLAVVRNVGSSSRDESKDRDENLDNIEALLQIRVLSLDWQNFKNIDNLDAFTNSK